MLKVLVIDDEVFVRKGIVMETDWASLDAWWPERRPMASRAWRRAANTTRI